MAIKPYRASPSSCAFCSQVSVPRETSKQILNLLTSVPSTYIVPQVQFEVSNVNISLADLTVLFYLTLATPFLQPSEGRTAFVFKPITKQRRENIVEEHTERENGEVDENAEGASRN